jgi:hypothetical protein
MRDLTIGALVEAEIRLMQALPLRDAAPSPSGARPRPAAARGYFGEPGAWPASGRTHRPNRLVAPAADKCRRMRSSGPTDVSERTWPKLGFTHLVLIRESDFAQKCNVNKSRVSQWITAGQISGDAIVGDGRGAQLDAAVALKQLRERLATDERFGLNGLSTNLDWLPDEIAATPAPRTARATPEGEDPETVEAKIKAEKLKQSKFLTLRLERDERAGRGLYMDAQEANAGMARVADDMLKIFLKIFEGAFPEFASALMAHPPTSAREAIHLLRIEFRRVCEQLAAVHGAALAAEAQTEEVD